MAYMLCGICIYRDANIVEGFPIHEIPRERMRRGDLLFFPGHVAVYLGEGATATPPDALATTASPSTASTPDAADFRPDLAAKLSAVGSYF